MPPVRAMLAASILSSLLLAPCRAGAAPLLHCHLRQGDAVLDTQAAISAEPYRVAAVAVNRFRFKAVVAGADGRVDYVKLYTYYETGRGAEVRLLHEASYAAPPVARGAAPASLSGAVSVYEPTLGREFNYDCALREEGA